ncbi:MAG: DUF4136 domain-containing protein [Alphaproteobacteria bacterium]|nr:MAG: DUF4136 domain-containing protein [Alphaproteobacteria bacterium]
MRWSKLLVAGLVLLLGACAAKVETSVTRFHEGLNFEGQSFVVLPLDAAKNGPEFQQYAGLITEAMGRYGFRPADAEDADLRVLVDYAVSEGRTKIETRPGYVFPAYSYYLGFYHPFYYGYYDPFYYDGFLGPEIHSKTVYTRKLSLRIENAKTGKVVFEGRAVSEGPTQEISLVMPYLVESMFRNFPGESGATKVVEIKTRDGHLY